MAYGRSIELFLANGTADSLIIAEFSNWNGKAIKIPRIEVAKCDRDDFKQAGVYFLFYQKEGEKDAVYIGEAENIKERLIQHIRDNRSEKEQSVWNTAIAFVGRDLNKALIRYLEHQFVEIARQCNRYKVLTKNTYKNTIVKESQIEAMKEFIDNVRILINVLGYNVLEPFLHSDSVDDALLYIKTENVDAKGKVTREGFVVLKGTTINGTSSKSLGESMVRLREKYISEGKIENMTTTEDILFSSSSAAANFILGYNESGPKVWKNKAGRSLKDLDDMI